MKIDQLCYYLDLPAPLDCFISSSSSVLNSVMKYIHFMTFSLMLHSILLSLVLCIYTSTFFCALNFIALFIIRVHTQFYCCQFPRLLLLLLYQVHIERQRDNARAMPLNYFKQHIRNIYSIDDYNAMTIVAVYNIIIISRRKVIREPHPRPCFTT